MYETGAKFNGSLPGQPSWKSMDRDTDRDRVASLCEFAINGIRSLNNLTSLVEQLIYNVAARLILLA